MPTKNLPAAPPSSVSTIVVPAYSALRYQRTEFSANIHISENFLWTIFILICVFQLGRPRGNTNDMIVKSCAHINGIICR